MTEGKELRPEGVRKVGGARPQYVRRSAVWERNAEISKAQTNRAAASGPGAKHLGDPDRLGE